MGFRMLQPAALLVAALLLAGCMPTEPAVTPVPEPSVTPIFATDEDALAAATEAYAKYLAVSDEITADGGTGAERISNFVTPDQYEDEVDGFEKFIASGSHTRGDSVSNVFGLQRHSNESDGTASIVLYICVDVSGVAILNDSNEDITPAIRPNKYPLEVEFLALTSSPLDLKIARSDTWSGTDFCQL